MDELCPECGLPAYSNMYCRTCCTCDRCRQACCVCVACPNCSHLEYVGFACSCCQGARMATPAQVKIYEAGRVIRAQKTERPSCPRCEQNRADLRRKDLLCSRCVGYEREEAAQE